MVKRHLVKLVLSLTIFTSLLGGGAALHLGAPTAKAAPVSHPASHEMACILIILPPCI